MAGTEAAATSAARAVAVAAVGGHRQLLLLRQLKVNYSGTQQPASIGLLCQHPL